MGAIQFKEFVRKTDKIRTATEAFHHAVEGAIYEYGHGGYSGTIKEKNSFLMAGKAFNRKHASRMSIILMETDFDDKWGPAGCIEIVKGTPTGREFTIKKMYEAYEEADAINTFRIQAPSDSILVSEPKVVLKKEGKLEHIVENNDNKMNLRYVVKGEGKKAIFTSKSKAIKYAKERGPRYFSPFRNESVLTIEQKKVTDTGDSHVVRVTSIKRPNLYEVSAKAKNIDFTSGEVEGWYFFGWASY